MAQLMQAHKPGAPKRDRPIIIVEGRAYRLRECTRSGPSELFNSIRDLFGYPPMPDRYEIDMITTSGREIRGEYKIGTVSWRDSGRRVYEFTKSRAQAMLEEWAERVEDEDGPAQGAQVDTR